MGDRTNNANGQKNPRQEHKKPLDNNPTARKTEEPNQLTNPITDDAQKNDTQKTNTPIHNLGYESTLEWDIDIDPSLRED